MFLYLLSIFDRAILTYCPMTKYEYNLFQYLQKCLCKQLTMLFFICTIYILIREKCALVNNMLLSSESTILILGKAVFLWEIKCIFSCCLFCYILASGLFLGIALSCGDSLCEPLFERAVVDSSLINFYFLIFKKVP